MIVLIADGKAIYSRDIFWPKPTSSLCLCVLLLLGGRVFFFSSCFEKLPCMHPLHILCTAPRWDDRQISHRCIFPLIRNREMHFILLLKIWFCKQIELSAVLPKVPLSDIYGSMKTLDFVNISFSQKGVFPPPFFYHFVLSTCSLSKWSSKTFLGQLDISENSNNENRQSQK